MSEIVCYKTGILFTIGDGSSGFKISLQHPLASMNAVRKIQREELHKMSPACIVGSIFTVLREYKLLQCHDKDVIFRANQRISKEIKHSQLVQVLHELIIREKKVAEFSQSANMYHERGKLARKGFSLDACIPAGTEDQKLTVGFAANFIAWVRYTVNPNTDALFEIVQATQKRDMGRELQNVSIEQAQGEYGDYLGLIDALYTNISDEVCRTARRMKTDSITTRVKSLADTLTEYGVLDIVRKRKIYDIMNAGHVSDKIATQVRLVVLDKAKKLPDPGKTKKCYEFVAWFDAVREAFDRAVRDLDTLANCTLEEVESAVKHNTGESLQDRLARLKGVKR